MLLLITWNIHRSTLSRLYLQGLTKTITHFHSYKDKKCKTKSSICLVVGLRECPDLHGQLQEQRVITFLPGSGQHHEVCEKQPHPSPLCIKEAWVIAQIKWLFWTLINHLLRLSKESYYSLLQHPFSQLIGLLLDSRTCLYW